MPDAVQAAGSPTTRMVRWLAGLRRTAMFVAAVFLITAALRINEFIDATASLLERLNVIQSPTLRLAENTARSAFSERLARLAWRRLYWGRLAAQRVVDEAPLADVDSAWAAYINAAADWNSEVMILIVGLQRHYGEGRRHFFEGEILQRFSAFDDALREVRRSAVMRKLRAAQSVSEPERADIRSIFEAFKSRYEDLNIVLYDFALCFEPGRALRVYCKPGDASATAGGR